MCVIVKSSSYSPNLFLPPRPESTRSASDLTGAKPGGRDLSRPRKGINFQAEKSERDSQQTPCPE